MTRPGYGYPPIPVVHLWRCCPATTSDPSKECHTHCGMRVSVEEVCDDAQAVSCPGCRATPAYARLMAPVSS